MVTSQCFPETSTRQRRRCLTEKEALYNLIGGIIEQAQREVAGNFTWAPGMSECEKARRQADAARFLSEWQDGLAKRVRMIEEGCEYEVHS